MCKYCEAKPITEISGEILNVPAGGSNEDDVCTQPLFYDEKVGVLALNPLNLDTRTPVINVVAYFNDYGIRFPDIDINFCPYCGRQLVEIPTSDLDDLV